MQPSERDEIRDLLKRTAVALKEGGVPFALCGGYAAWVRGAPEPDHDADFLVPESEAARAAKVLAVLSVQMPVLLATDIVVTKLMALDEHYCDFARLLPFSRALREQVDWAHVRSEVADNDFAVVFLQLLERLRVLPEVSAA